MGKGASLRAKRSILTAAASMFALLTGASAQAQSIATDGTTTTSVFGSGMGITVDGGTIAGANQFHSFSTFNIGVGEGVTFSYGGPGTIDNVISRVTGGSPSTIDGLMRSNVPGADFYFINPVGVTFGSGASIDVSGAFHVSTADRLSFANGDVMLSLGGSTFSVAAPQAFGFLGANVGDITFNATQYGSINTIDVTAANVQVNDAFLQTNGGFLRLVAAGTGIVEAPVSGAAPIGALNGDVTVTGANAVVRSTGYPVPNAPTHVVSIYAHDVILDDGLLGAGSHQGTPALFLIQADTFVARNNASLILVSGVGVADALFEIDANTVSIGDAVFVSGTNGSNGEAGDLIIRADTIDIARSVFSAGSNGDHDAGDIDFVARDLTVTDSQIVTFTAGPADAGDISFIIGSSLQVAGSRFIANTAGPLIPEAPVPIAHGRGGNIVFFGPSAAMTLVSTQVLSQTGSWDPGSFGGNISIDARSLTVDRGQILATSGHRDFWGQGGAAPAGDITINVADGMTVLGASLISALTLGNGPGGDVIITARMLDFFGDPLGVSRIDSLTTGFGPGGSVTINIGERLHVQYASINAVTLGPSDAGDLFVNAPNAEIMVEGFRTANGTPAGLAATSGAPPGAAVPPGTIFSGHGGNVHVIADRIILRDTGFIGSSGLGPDGANAGNVNITANNIDMFSAGSIQSASESGDAGTITIEMPSVGVLRMRDAVISTSNGAVGGSGGQISISRPAAIILEGGAFTPPLGTVITGDFVTGIEALGEIEAANINIASDYFIRSMERPSRVAVNGTLVLDTLAGDPVAAAAALDAGFLNAGDVLASQCAAQRAGAASVLSYGDASAPASVLPSPLAAPAFYSTELAPNVATSAGGSFAQGMCATAPIAW
jgi:filamentous hemagglutinin family protein